MVLRKTFELTFSNKVNFDKDSFLTSKSNQDAMDWLQKWPEWPNGCLVVYGDKGCGKSHLGKIWMKCVSGLQLSNAEFDALTALPYDTDILIDGAHKIANEELLFHLYNRVNQEGGSLLMLSEKPTSQWDVSLPDLRSRIKAIHNVEVKVPDDELVIGVLRKLFKDHQLEISDAIVNYLATHIERSYHSMLKAVKIIDDYALLHKKNITLPLVKAALETMDA